MGDPQNNLKEVSRKIQEIQKSAERTGETFNVFSILNNEKTHSAIIAELLNPLGSHNQETLFLKLFLEKLLEDEIPKLKCGEEGLSDEYLKKFEVRVEVSFDRKIKEGKTERRRIDILIEKDDDCVVIENKIWADDQWEQLKSYYEYATTKSGDPILIYLTPYGCEPGKYTLGDLPKDKVVCLSYKDFIDEWLDACIKKVAHAHIPQIKNTLHQYRITVRELTKQLPHEVERYIERIYTEEKLKGDILKDLQHELQRELQCVFWKKLKERLADGLTLSEGLTFKNLKFQLYKSNINEDTEILDEDIDAKLIEKIEDIGERRNSSLGLTFSNRDSLLDKKHEVAFRIYYERSDEKSYFTYGFVFRRKRNTEDTFRRVKIEQEHKNITAVKRCMRLGHGPKDGEGWISWDYFQYEPESFITEGKETLIRKLISKINFSWSEAKKDNKE